MMNGPGMQYASTGARPPPTYSQPSGQPIPPHYYQFGTGNNHNLNQPTNRAPMMPPPPTSMNIPPNSQTFQSDSSYPMNHPYAHQATSASSGNFDNVYSQNYGTNIESVQIQRTSSYEQNLGSRGGNNSPNPPSSSGSIKRTTSRIDPGQMPRPDKPTIDAMYHTKSGSARKNPPSVNSIFTSIDTGNCNPRYMRSSLVAPPCNKDLLDQTGLPLALHVTPFAALENDEEAVAEINLNQAPPRCSRCKCYINPSVTWTDGGNKWTCNMCNMSNVIPDWYFSSLDAAGLRIDRLQRPELIKGSVDFIVGNDYCVQPPQDHVIVFAIDTSEEAQRLGITVSSLRVVLKAVEYLESLLIGFNQNSFESPQSNPQSAYPFANPFFASTTPKDPIVCGKLKIGIITFDENINFFSVEQGCFDPVRMFVGNADDPFAILPPHKWIFSLGDEKECIVQVLAKIPELLRVHREGSTIEVRQRDKLCSHAVVRAVQDCLKISGGKLYLFASSHSTTGVDSINFDRGQLADYGSPQEILLYSVPQNSQQISKSLKSSNSYTNLSIGGTETSATPPKVGPNTTERITDHLTQLKALHDSSNDLAMACNKSNMGITAFFFSEQTPENRFRDNSFLSELCVRTGGRLFLVRGSMLLEDNISRLEDQLTFDLQSFIGSNSTWKLRTSVGLRVDHVVGMGQYQLLDDELQASSLDTQSTAMYLMKYDGGLKDEDKVFLQLAVLYTALNKQRRVRVHNLTLVASNKASTVFRNSDTEVVISTIVKISAEKVLSFPLNDEKNGPRGYLQNNLVEILLRYRKLCSAQSPRGQLILPEALKVLPIYTLAALKHSSFIENVHASNNMGSPNSRNNNGGKSLPNVLVTAHERSFEIRKLLSCTAKEVINSLYPRVFNLLYLIEEDSEGVDFAEHDHSPGLSVSRPSSFLMPLKESTLFKLKNKFTNTLHATAEVFESDQIYLLDDRSTIYVYIGRSVPQDLLEELFLLSSQLPYDRPEHLAVRNDTALGRRVHHVLEFLRSDNLYKQDMKVLWADLHNSNPSLHKFAARLIEDSNAGMMTYVDYLCNVHAKIQSKL